MIRFCGHTMGMPGKGLGACLELLAEMGHEGVEVRCAPDGQIDPHAWTSRLAEHARSQAGRVGVQFVCLTPYAKNYLDSGARAAGIDLMKRTIDIACDLGSPFVRAYGGQEVPPELHEQAWSATVGGLADLCDYAAERNVTLVVETHIGTLTLTAADAAAMVDQVKRTNIGVLLDYAWVHYIGQETIDEALTAVGARLRYLHVKDHCVIDREQNQRRSTLMGQGEVDWPQALTAIRSSGYDGFACDEYEKYWSKDLPPAEIGMRHNLGYLREHLSGSRP